jgi:GWxTD domain-containing protein
MTFFTVVAKRFFACGLEFEPDVRKGVIQVIPFPSFFRFVLSAGLLLTCGVIPLQARETDQKDAASEMPAYYQRWLDEDVRWIITAEEAATFKKLSTNRDRDQFIEQFWQRRDPTPDTEENEYKEEYYRRIAYANEHFGARVPGWKTDRGRMYIMYGKPDSIDSHPMGGPYQRPPEEGGGSTETYPFEIWRYRYLEGIGQKIEIEFVDPCSCGTYEMTLDRSEKEALLKVPHAGAKRNGTKELEVFIGAIRPPAIKFKDSPAIKFKDLEAVVNSKIRYNLLHFDVRVDFVKVTSDTVLVPITIQVPNRELTFVNRDGVPRAVVNIFGRITTLTGRVAQTFEEAMRLDVPAEPLDKVANNVALYWKALLLRPGHYRLDIVVKDVNGDKLGTIGQSVQVPDFSEDKLASSTLILADVMERVPSREVGAGDFVLGSNKVRPKVQLSNGIPVSFKRDQKVNFWMQVYNLALDEKAKKSSATVQYQIVNTTTNQPMVDITESTDQMGNVGDQMTLQKTLPLGKLDPGVYQLTIKVNDLLSKQTISPTAKFRVE